MAIPPGSRKRLLRRNMLFAVLLWTASVAGSWWWSYSLHQDRIIDLARVQTETNINKDWAFRLWATSHGGVYVPPDKNTPPNPYLAKIPDRDLVSTTGKRLTLMNPAYMLRQIMDHYSNLYGVKGHITSLNLTNPINMPDPWESAALKKFRSNPEPISAVAEIDGKPYLRVIRPIPMEKGCMKCHSDLGIKVGEIRGGISAAVPLEPIEQAFAPDLRNSNIVHGLAWILGIAAIGLLAWRSKRETDHIDRYQQVLFDSESRIRLLLDSTAEGIYELDSNGNCTLINQSALRMLGASKQGEMLGKQMHSLIHHTRADGTPYPWGECKACLAINTGAQVHSSEEFFWRLDGNRFPVEYWAYPILRDGVVTGVVVAFIDITDRKQAEAEIIKLNSGLEQRVIERTAQFEAANKDLESFSYSVSHDLRAPLRAIDGFSLIVLEDYSDKLDDEGKRVIGVIRQNTQKMGELIDNILDFSRAGRKEIELSEIDMEQLVRSVFEQLKPDEAERSVQFKVSPLPKASGDLAMIRQVWTNLISNALKFTQHKPIAVIEIDSRSEDGENIYQIRDNGAGFDMQYANKLFGVFQRLHGSEFEGTGVGLAIVKRIVQKHGGRVGAFAREGEGATFFFSLRRAQGEADREAT